MNAIEAAEKNDRADKPQVDLEDLFNRQARTMPLPFLRRSYGSRLCALRDAISSNSRSSSVARQMPLGGCSFVRRLSTGADDVRSSKRTGSARLTAKTTRLAVRPGGAELSVREDSYSDNCRSVRKFAGGTAG